jgi:hypothetical protein
MESHKLNSYKLSEEEHNGVIVVLNGEIVVGLKTFEDAFLESSNVPARAISSPEATFSHKVVV